MDLLLHALLSSPSTFRVMVLLAGDLTTIFIFDISDGGWRGEHRRPRRLCNTFIV
jgi:hypothetical protein